MKFRSDRRKLISGAAALAAYSGLARADGLSGSITPQPGGGLFRPAASVSSFVPLAGSVIDMDFVGNQYFGGTLANLMNADQTQAIGALLNGLLNTAAGSMVISLKALASAPTGSPLWFTDDPGSNNFIYGQSNTVARSNVDSGDIISATIGGGGTFTGGPTKIGISWSDAAGRTLVANNGTPVTSVSNFVLGPSFVFINLPVLTNFLRLAYWNVQLSGAALAGFTI